MVSTMWADARGGSQSARGAAPACFPDAVGVAQEDHLADTQLGRGRALLALAPPGQPARPQIGIVAALVAAGEQDVADLFGPPATTSPPYRAAEFRVIRVCGDHHDAGERLRRLSHGRSPRPAPASRRFHPQAAGAEAVLDQVTGDAVRTVAVRADHHDIRTAVELAQAVGDLAHDDVCAAGDVALPALIVLAAVQQVRRLAAASCGYQLGRRPLPAP